MAIDIFGGFARRRLRGAGDGASGARIDTNRLICTETKALTCTFCACLQGFSSVGALTSAGTGDKYLKEAYAAAQDET